MNPIDKYLAFYQGKNRRAIYRLFSQFIECLRSDDRQTLESLLTEDCAADISMIGKVHGRPACLQALAWP